MALVWTPFGIGIAWVVLHSADYLLTIATARLLRRGDLPERVKLGGSPELNPLFQRTVNRGAWVSGRFVATLVLGAVAFPAWIALTPAEANPGSTFAHQALAGALVVSRLHVIANHLHNVVLFRRLLRAPEAAAVTLRYDRGTVFASTRARVAGTAAFCALAVAVTDAPFFWGGLVAMLLLAAITVLWERRAAGSLADARRPA